MSTYLKFHLPQPEFLTQEQKNLIRVDLSDEQRKGRGENLIVKGYGGTGKTVVAYYRALRYKQEKYQNENKKVLFLCFNKLLNAHLKGETDIPLPKNCDTMYLDEFYKNRRAKLKNDIENGQNSENGLQFGEGYFTNNGRTEFIYHTKDGEELHGTTLAKEQKEDFLNVLSDYFLYKNTNQPLYEEIIIDEGQDLSIAWIKTLKKLTPHISIFADDNQQINGGCTITQMKEILSPKGEVQILIKGMRTTREIFEYAVYAFLPDDEQATALETASTCRSDENSTPDETSRSYSTPTNWKEMILNQIQKIPTIPQNKTLNFEDILIVCPKQANIDELESYFHSKGCIPSIYHNRIEEKCPFGLVNGWKKGKNENIKITTYQSAKGLESDIVIVFITKDEYLKFVNGTNGDLGDHTFYVLATRAKKRVYFVTDFQLEEVDTDTDK